MTNIGHFLAAGKLLEQYDVYFTTRLWMSPPTKMDKLSLKEEGLLQHLCKGWGAH